MKFKKGEVAGKYRKTVEGLPPDENIKCEEFCKEVTIDGKTYMVHPKVHDLIEYMNSDIEIKVIQINEFIEEMNKLDGYLRDFYPEKLAAYMATHKKSDRSPVELIIEILTNRNKLILLN